MGGGSNRCSWRGFLGPSARLQFRAGKIINAHNNYERFWHYFCAQNSFTNRKTSRRPSKWRRETCAKIRLINFNGRAFRKYENNNAMNYYNIIPRCFSLVVFRLQIIILYAWAAVHITPRIIIKYTRRKIRQGVGKKQKNNNGRKKCRYLARGRASKIILRCTGCRHVAIICRISL